MNNVLSVSNVKKVLGTDGEVIEAVFRLDSFDLDSLLTELEQEQYHLCSLGFANVQSLVDAVTVCGFVNKNGYLYTAFYFSITEGEFVIKLFSSPKKLATIIINDAIVSLKDNVGNSTLIRNFDFGDFKSHNLIQ